LTARLVRPACLSCVEKHRNQKERKTKLLTQVLREQLLRNGRLRQQFAGIAHLDSYPVVRLFTPDAQCTWLLTELDPEEPDIGFGLCDLGLGFPELGNVSIDELESVRGKLGLSIERDLQFSPLKPISAYAEEAALAGRITV
jgi:hypothetical protein